MIAAFFRNLFRDLMRQKLRTALTLSGVVWGTFSVVLLLAFGVSVSKAQLKSFRGMGQGIVLVFPARTTIAYQGFIKGKPIRVTPEEVEALPAKVGGIAAISPEFVLNRRIRYKLEERLSTVRGVNPVFESIRNTIAGRGRFLNSDDLHERRRVCFIGDKLAEDLFKKEEPIGKQVFIEGIPFTVIGVQQKKQQNSNYNGQRDEKCAFIPWTTFSSAYGNKYVSNFIFRPADISRARALTREVRIYLAKKMGFSPEDKDALFVWDFSEFEKKFTVFFLAFTIFLGMIGSFTLLVGGVGVASIMMVVVEERVREIGIKLAVGAKRRQILWQFFSEALVIMAIGGLIGIFLSTLAVRLMPRGDFTEFIGMPQIDTTVALATALILLAIGTISGLMPARRAAATHPVEALKKA